jgi:hypothetical protein
MACCNPREGRPGGLAGLSAMAFPMSCQIATPESPIYSLVYRGPWALHPFGGWVGARPFKEKAFRCRDETSSAAP